MTRQERSEICKKARAAKAAGVAKKYPKTINGVARLIWAMIEKIMNEMENEKLPTREGYALVATYTAQLSKIYQFQTSNEQKAEIENKLDQVLTLINGDGKKKVVKNHDAPAIKINKSSAILVETVTEPEQQPTPEQPN